MKPPSAAPASLPMPPMITPAKPISTGWTPSVGRDVAELRDQ